MKRVVIASDSFKGSLSSLQVADAIEVGIRRALGNSENLEIVKVPVADGGEGTLEALLHSLGGEIVSCKVHDPLMREIETSYALLRTPNVETSPNFGKSAIAVIEMASASGLPLLSTHERNPWFTSTYGTGEIIADALERGCRRFLVGIGGSATNDGGIGAFAALGYKFLDENGKVLLGSGGDMCRVTSIDSSAVNPKLLDSTFTIACDVETPFCGPQGAALIFAPQKGADPHMVKVLDKGLENLAGIIARDLGREIKEIPGSGAAGGLGGGFLAFCNSSLKKGIDMVLDAIDFDSIISGADLVVTGEGRIDSQTFKGKTPYGIMQHARAADIPVYAIGGCVDLKYFCFDGDGRVIKDVKGFNSIAPAVWGDFNLQAAMEPETAKENVARAAEKLIRETCL